MATMTYDPTEVQEGELSEEEQDSLAVGEKLEEQSQELLAGKFKDAEALEKKNQRKKLRRKKNNLSLMVNSLIHFGKKQTLSGLKRL
jgi:hypothetical protein